MTKKNKEVLRCIHRHTIEEHPNCFRKGLIKRTDWWFDKTIASLDIETTHLDANWGCMLTWCLKYLNDPKIRHGVIKREELFNGTYDKRILNELMEELENVDILMTYYGTGFDIKFLRTRCMFFDIAFPSFGSIYHWDLYYKVRSKMKLHRNSLAVATKFLGIHGKTPLSGPLLMAARYGEPKALKEILHHNVEDVKITEALYKRLAKHAKWIKKSI